MRKMKKGQPRAQKLLDGPQARARRDQAQAAFLETKNAQAKGLLLPADDVERAWTAEVTAARSRLLSWSIALTPQLQRAATERGEAGIAAELERAVREVLTELSEGKHAAPAKAKRAAHGVART